MSVADLPTLAEGKTKIVKENPADPTTVWLCFKDDITAGDGLRHDLFVGKAALDWAVSRDCFDLLARHGLPTHVVDSPEEGVMLVRRLDHRFDLEVVTRRVATGSILQWSDASEGQRFDPLVTRFHGKDDPLHDPMLDDGYIDFVIREKDGWEYAAMRDMSARAFLVLEAAFATQGMQLVDLKLEYGIVDGQLCLIDEISGGSLRLWPYRSSAPHLDQGNVLGELVPEGRLDKDTYRMGGDANQVLAGFRALAEVTSRFGEIA